MTKKTLQGIATGILLTTILFAYHYYFTDRFHILIEETTEIKNITEQDIEEYLAANHLVVVDEIDYEQLLEKLAKAEELEQNNEAVTDNTIERIIIKEVVFTIEPGTSSSSIALLLEEKGLINSKEQFETYLFEKGLETKLKAGNYSLTSDMSLEEIAEKLT